MSGLAELQSLFDELELLLASRGVNTDPPDPATVQTDIAVLERKLAEHQLEIHPHLRWLWETWPPLASDIVHPGFTGPSFAAELLEDRNRIPSLVVIGYGQHRDLLLDLIPSEFGPGIYVHDYYENPGINLVFAGIADLLRYLITFIDDMPEPPYIGADVESPFEFVMARERLAGLLPPSIADDEKRPISDEIDTWPHRWRLARNLGDDVATCRGATHTVAELMAARLRGQVEATLVVAVATVGGSGNGTQVRLTDGTGSVEARILPGAPDFGRSPTGTYEVDVVADRQVGSETSIDDFSGDHAEVSRLADIGLYMEAAEAGRDMVMRGLGEHMTGDAPIRVTARRPVT